MDMTEHVELRSDTFTTPTPEMRRAMADAEVGDDEYGEDPTVNRLQSLVAGLLGTEASLYVPSGTSQSGCICTPLFWGEAATSYWYTCERAGHSTSVPGRESTRIASWFAIVPDGT